MAENEQKPDSNKPLINKDDVLTTQARRIVFDCLMQGFNAKEAAEKAKLGSRYVQNILVKSGMNELVKQEQAKISEKTGITVELCQRKFAEIAEIALKKGKEGVARACYADLCKTMGGFQADAPNPKGLMDKKINKELVEFVNQYYRRKYLAAEPVKNVIDVGITEPNNGETSDVDGQSKDRLPT